MGCVGSQHHKRDAASKQPRDFCTKATTLCVWVQVVRLSYFCNHGNPRSSGSIPHHRWPGRHPNALKMACSQKGSGLSSPLASAQLTRHPCSWPGAAAACSGTTTCTRRTLWLGLWLVIPTNISSARLSCSSEEGNSTLSSSCSISQACSSSSLGMLPAGVNERVGLGSREVVGSGGWHGSSVEKLPKRRHPYEQRRRGSTSMLLGSLSTTYPSRSPANEMEWNGDWIWIPQ